MTARAWRPLVVGGLPRCGTTLLSTLLASQPRCAFLTDYLSAFLDAASDAGGRWGLPLSLTQRRIALAKVRDQLLRFRHPVLVGPDQFGTLAELHRAVLAELARPDDLVVGHKLVLEPRQVRALLDETQCRVVVLYRDPRDAALSWFHRTGGDVEGYVERWRQMVRFLRQTSSERLFAIRYESMVQRPREALGPLFDALGLPLDVDRAELVFRGPRGSLKWSGNASVESPSDFVPPRSTPSPRTAFDPRAIGRWREHRGAPLVRYVDAVTRPERARFDYAESVPMSVGEAARWRVHAEAHRLAGAAQRWWDRGRAEALAKLAPPLRLD